MEKTKDLSKTEDAIGHLKEDIIIIWSTMEGGAGTNVFTGHLLRAEALVTDMSIAIN
jgi:hypothetical protein